MDIPIDILSVVIRVGCELMFFPQANANVVHSALRQPRVVIFKKGIDQIFPDDAICSIKANALANFLVPNIMYIPFNQIEQIKKIVKRPDDNVLY